MVKDTYQGMKVFIEQLSFDVPRGSLPNLYSAFMITILGICSGLDCLGKHIHCGANSGSSFRVRFELATCKFVFIHTQYLDWLAAIGDVFCLIVGVD